MSRSERDADVIVVGAGPAGSATAHRLAASGRDVLLLERAQFPRDKVCGDGLTPRAVRSLIEMGVDISPERGWARNNGLRIIANGRTYELPWPELERFPELRAGPRPHGARRDPRPARRRRRRPARGAHEGPRADASTSAPAG